jgi:hypothetical protein
MQAGCGCKGDGTGLIKNKKEREMKSEMESTKLNKEEIMKDKRVKLFRAYSYVNNFWGRNGVPFSWYVVDREKPVVPYDQLIKDFSRLSEADKNHGQDLANELFTEVELEQFTEYLLRVDNVRVEAVEVRIPIEAAETCGGGDLYPLSHIAVSSPRREQDGFIQLGKDYNKDGYSFMEGYTLPFFVEGYYDLRLAETTEAPRMAL